MANKALTGYFIFQPKATVSLTTFHATEIEELDILYRVDIFSSMYNTGKEPFIMIL